MGLCKTEVNLRRLLVSAPRQQNQVKLAHYVATLRELLEHLAEERTLEGSQRVPKAMLSEYSEKIEAIAAKLVAPSELDEQECEVPSSTNSPQESPKALDGYHSPTLGLRKRLTPASTSHDRTHNKAEDDKSGSIHLDDAAHAHLEKHRKLQENLTDEMVGLARQLKERSLIMSQSLQNTERILDSTERAVEQSLASTNRVNVRATEIYSESSKTTCFTWLIIFLMTCVFVMVVLLIRVT
ncbi:hypothetical protein MLD38_009156 [Melastoma candidum]|uniref:Uncharacterized protein n=1 Tax=Melastoma candidum TaxID=119954 RepID=A0ACB9RX68_9MYRT|nr:hypothetical protein MLD38_009156 [Melastoma candidum]